MRIAVALLMLGAFAWAQEPIRISGRATHAGAGVAARITAWDAAGEGRFLGEADSEKGAFELVLTPEELARREHPFGPVVLRVRSDTMAERRVEVSLEDPTAEIELEPAVVIEGRVEDWEGKPYPGAVVRGTTMGNVKPSERVVEETTTDEMGVFRLRRFPDGAVYVVAHGIWESEKRIVWRSDVVLRFDRPVKEEPKPTFLIEGTVVDEEGRLLPGARVEVGDRVEGAWTGTNGRFRLEVTQARMVELRAQRRGYLPAAVRVEGSHGGRVQLQLRRGRTLNGEVIPPRPGVRVGAYAEPLGEELAFTYSRPDGRFEFEALPDEARLLAAWGRRSRSASMPATDRVELTTHPRMSLRGTLTSDAGHPLSGVELRGAGELALTDAEGRFDFGEVAIRWWIVEAEPNDHDPVSWTVRPGDDLPIVARSRLGELSLKVEVLDAPGKVVITMERRSEPRVRREMQLAHATFEHLPAGTYDVTIRAEARLDEQRVVKLDANTPPLRIKTREAGTLSLFATPGARVVVQTLEGEPAPVVVLELAEGTRRVHGFGPGRYRFLSRAEGELIAIHEVTCGPQSPPQEVDLRAGKAAKLMVTVNDRTGDPVEGAKVTITTAAGFELPYTKLTDRNGRAVIKRLPEGKVEVRASLGERLAGTTVEIVAGATLHAAIELP